MAKNNSKKGQSGSKNTLTSLSERTEGATFACVRRLNAPDVVPALKMARPSVDFLLKELEAFSSALSSSQIYLEHDGQRIGIDAKLSRALSLYIGDPAAEKHIIGSNPTMELFVFQKGVPTLMHVRDLGNGAYEEIPAEGDFAHTPAPLISFDEFQERIIESISLGRIKPSQSTKYSSANKRELAKYTLTIPTGTANPGIRLDSACAALKLDGPVDSYGMEIQGATLVSSDGDWSHPHWAFTYSYDPNGASESMLATVDHVIAKSEGGSLGIKNLQLMRKTENNDKASEPYYGIPQNRGRCLEIIEMLDEGASLAVKEERLSPSVYKKLRSALDFERAELADIPEMPASRMTLMRLLSALGGEFAREPGRESLISRLAKAERARISNMGAKEDGGGK